MPRRKPAKGAVTKAWIRNPGDERAVDNGCWFDPAVGGFVAWWIERFCRLYEGESAGEPLTLRGCHRCGNGLVAPDEWGEEAEASAVERARLHAECVRKGHPIDWQYDATLRLFGWQRRSERWARAIRRFRKASIWVPKKNKKSPTMAAWGLYLLAGDGEQGNKVYFCAKDGSQAREIAGKHAVEMVEQSHLASECSINRTSFQITHEPTRSILKPLSSGDSKTQKAKEGLNGSVMIDETHVVDREFVGRISRAGISRVEPLHVEVSTAGDDPESYGQSRFDYALAVERGDESDQELFVALHAAPQDLTAEALAADPAHWGRLANPAWGHTVGDEEYLADYNESRRSPSELARFMMYRLNVWQAAATPWLDMGHWAGCRRTYGLEDLEGHPCWAGLDLAKVRDTCALVLVFELDAEQERFRQWPLFWLPRRRAEELRDKVRYKDWAAAGHLTLTDGDVTDYQVIRRDLVGLKRRLGIRKLAYDGTYAAQLVQRLVEEDHAFTTDELCIFAQTITDFASPTDYYEGLVIEHKIEHPGNPLLTWQAGNAKVKTDANANKRPVKQKHGDVRTIDGVVAAIMALEMARLGKGEAAWYRPGALRS